MMIIMISMQIMLKMMMIISIWNNENITPKYIYYLGTNKKKKKTKWKNNKKYDH